LPGNELRINNPVSIPETLNNHWLGLLFLIVSLGLIFIHLVPVNAPALLVPVPTVLPYLTQKVARHGLSLSEGQTLLEGQGSGK
jgi:hypothetical protein